jgi:hypothetical protein
MNMLPASHARRRSPEVILSFLLALVFRIPALIPKCGFETVG